MGGEGRRVNGLEKYFFTLGGRTFIERLIDTLEKDVDEIILVAKDPAQCDRFAHLEKTRCVTDIRKLRGPIGGLHAGATAARGDLLFVCACDMPCVSSAVVHHLFTLVEDFDAVIPAWSQEMIEPLHAVYRRLPLLHYLETQESFSLRHMVRNLRCRYVDIGELEVFDPEHRSFVNINRLEDLKKLS